jgi:transposase InsO family protein
MKNGGHVSTDVGSAIQPGRAPAEWLAGMPTREFSKPTIRENRRTDDRRTVSYTRQEADLAIGRYIDGFYNPVRRHSALDFTSPAQFEKTAAE